MKFVYKKRVCKTLSKFHTYTYSLWINSKQMCRVRIVTYVDRDYNIKGIWPKSSFYLTALRLD